SSKSFKQFEAVIYLAEMQRLLLYHLAYLIAILILKKFSSLIQTEAGAVQSLIECNYTALLYRITLYVAFAGTEVYRESIAHLLAASRDGRYLFQGRLSEAVRIRVLQ